MYKKNYKKKIDSICIQQCFNTSSSLFIDSMNVENIDIILKKNVNSKINNIFISEFQNGFDWTLANNIFKDSILLIQRSKEYSINDLLKSAPFFIPIPINKKVKNIDIFRVLEFNCSYKQYIIKNDFKNSELLSSLTNMYYKNIMDKELKVNLLCNYKYVRNYTITSMPHNYFIIPLK